MTLSVAIRHRQGDFRLDAAFEAPPGLTALFGRSGSGKTTIVNAIAGLIRPDAGRIAIDGNALFDSRTGTFVPAHRRRIGYVFQEGRLFPHMTVRRNLAYGGRFAPTPPTQREFDAMADLLGIGRLLDRRPGDLSGGEKQRVALGRAILSRPGLLLMDEPLAALDEQRKQEILPYIERLRDETGLPILYVSHSAAEVARLATTVVLMDQGRVTASGPAAEIFAASEGATAFGLRETGAILLATVTAHDTDGLTRMEAAGGSLFLPHVDAPVGTRLRLRLLAQDIMLALDRPEGISALNILPATIEEIRFGEGPGVLVRLSAGGEAILARITQHSARALSLAPGRHVFAVVKAVSVARGNVGAALPEDMPT